MSEEREHKEAAEFVLQWVRRRQGSPADLLRAVEQEAGWPGRLMLPKILDELRARRDLPDAERKFLVYTLNAGAIAEALAEGGDPAQQHQSSVDDLFTRSRRFRRSKKFGEAIEFLAKFREYSPFNNMLVYAQNPQTTHFATASHWQKAFGRSIKEEARGMVILAPRCPKFLVYTLNAGAIAEALAEGGDPAQQHQSSVDDLFTRSRRFRRSKKFGEAIEFLAKFREYSPFNNMLVYAQNPQTTHFATASHWQKAFGRSIKEEARGMVILAPRCPVLMVYDIADTEGPPLPEKLRHFAQTTGRFNPALLHRTVKNCERDQIQVRRLPMGELRGGFATNRARETGVKMRVGLRADLEDAAAYAVLCHELAHIYLGHVGADRDGWWPFRVNLSEAVAEIEAESVAHIVCARAGLRTRSAEYLSGFVEDSDDLDAISLDLISRVAGRLEEMGRRLLPPRS